MTRKSYLLHYFDFKNGGKFFLIAVVGLVLILGIILLSSRLLGLRNSGNRQHIRMVESFYEMVFSSTSILLFLSLYYMVDERIQAVAPYWEKYHDVFLLGFILCSVFMTNALDLVLVRLTNIKEEQKASIRLLSSFYIVLILLYIRFIYENSNYDTLILYFITLAAGRFVYFDFTPTEFKSMVQGVAAHLPLLFLMGIYSAVVCWYGFREGFLLTSNGVIVSILIAHLFMDLSIFILHKTRLLKLFL